MCPARAGCPKSMLVLMSAINTPRPVEYSWAARVRINCKEGCSAYQSALLRHGTSRLRRVAAGKETLRSNSNHSTPRNFRMGESAGRAGSLKRKVLASGMASLTVPPTRLLMRDRFAPGSTFTPTGMGLAACTLRELIHITPSSAMIKRHRVITFKTPCLRSRKRAPRLLLRIQLTFNPQVSEFNLQIQRSLGNFVKLEFSKSIHFGGLYTLSLLNQVDLRALHVSILLARKQLSRDSALSTADQNPQVNIEFVG